jgi:hypothetical protein
MRENEFFVDSNTLNRENDPWKSLDNVIRSWASLSGHEKDQNNYEILKNIYNKRYVTYVEEAEDGSGDAVLTFPPQLMEQLGWYEGLTLKFEVLDENSFTIQPANPADVVKKQHEK